MLGGAAATIFVSPNGQPRGDLWISEALVSFGRFDGQHAAGGINHQTDTAEVAAARGLHGEQAKMQSRAGLNCDVWRHVAVESVKKTVVRKMEF